MESKTELDLELEITDFYFSKKTETPLAMFTISYHPLETIINILQIEFDYQVPEDQIILKVLHSVDDNLQSLFLHLRSSSIPIAEISQKLIIAEEQLSLTKKSSYLAAKSTTLQRRVRTCWICG